VRAWIWFNVAATLALFTTTLMFLVRTARRERRLTPELALYLATITLGWMEAVIDWGAFVYYAPAWPRFPTNLPILRLIPILPLHIPLCYTWFFFGGAWLGVRLARVITRRFPTLSPTAALWIAGLAVGFVLDAVVENVFIALAGAWSYTQVWSPLALRAGTDSQWPVYMAFAMALSIGPMTWFLGHRNDRGEDVIEARARRDPAHPARAALVLVGWIVVVHLIYGGVSLGYAVLRWTGAQDTVSTVKPYRSGPAVFDGIVTKGDDATLRRTPIAKDR
jgi:hypothetical protein